MNAHLSRKIVVVLTGAGISAESGLKTFRDSDGLWEGYSIDEVATWSAWQKNPQLVLEFYNRRRRQVLTAEPNAAHFALAALEEHFDVKIITQNIDDLHERAGSQHVLHLHGEILKMRSENDPSLIYSIRDDLHWGDRAADGAQLRPHIVWFEEPVPMMEPAIEWVRQADLFLVVGTSLVVYPAAGLVQYAEPGIPKFIIDKKIPHSVRKNDFILFEQPASQGVQAFRTTLEKKGWLLV